MISFKKILFLFSILLVGYCLSVNILLNLNLNNRLDHYRHVILRKLHDKNLVNPFDVHKLKHTSTVSENLLIVDFSERDKFINDSILNLAFKEKSFKDELKIWRKANIYFDNQNFKIKYKFHGGNLHLYRVLGKKSFRIKSKKRLKGKKEFKLIHGYEADFLNIFISEFSQNLNLISPDPGEIILGVIDNKTEDYWLTSDVLKPYLKNKYNLEKYRIFETQDDWDRFNRDSEVTHISELDKFFQYQNHENQLTDSLSIFAFRKYRRLKNYAREESSLGINELLDEAYLGRFFANLYFFNYTHHIAGDNDKWLYDFNKHKFLPLMRNEGKIFSIKRGITNFDEGLFDYFQPKSDTYTLYKKLLINPELRQVRNSEFFKIVLKKDELIHKLDSIYLKYKYVQKVYVRDRYSNAKKALLNNISKIQEYLTNCQIAIAFNTETNTLELVTDTRVPLLLKVRRSNLEYLIKPISYKLVANKLESDIQEQYFAMDTIINKEDLIIINKITKDTILSDRIIFNFY